MSGGVDSSVAAALLKERGFRVVGVFMKPWQPKGMVCQWRQDREDALRVAARLDIPLLTWDFSHEYGERVAAPLLEGYRRGMTPNPDVECNRHIKFGLFFDRAITEGADFVATGHYARITRRHGRHWITVARDTNKDQTYFLWSVAPECLDRVLFPVGELQKEEVRVEATRLKLSVADKKDSQGVCFVGDIDFKSFLQRNIASRAGAILDESGAVIGQHDGAAYVTIGQRHGFGLPGGTEPQYVVAKNMKANTITVGPETSLMGVKMKIVETRWFGQQPREGDKVLVKIRYRTRAIPAHIGVRGIITCERPVRAISPGQSAVVYQGSRVIGGGIIA